MKAFSIFIALLFPLFSNAFEYTLYNQMIARAGQSLVNGEYQQALITFDSAMQLNKFPQARIIQNAAIAALKSKNKSKAIKYLQRLSKLGVGKAYFNQPDFLQLKSEPGWDTIYEGAQHHKRDFEIKNRQLNNQLVSMRAEALKVEDDYLHSEKSYADQQLFIRQKNKLSRSLIRLFIKSGYLSEYKIGVNIVEGHIADPIFTQVIQTDTKLPSPPDLFEIVINPTLQNLLVDFYKQGLIDQKYLSRLGYESAIFGL